MKKTLKAILLVTAVFLPIGASAQDAGKLGIRITASVSSMPNYIGDDESQVRALPDVTITYGDRFTASVDGGAKYSFGDLDGFSYGPTAYYHFGRSEDPTQNLGTLSGGATTDLVGLGEVAGTFELGGFAKYKGESFSADIVVRKGVSGGHSGVYGEAKADFTGDTKAGPFLIFYSFGPRITFGDASYNSTFFDVDADQSAASGLSQFDAGAGVISAGLHATVVVPFSEQTYVGLYGEFDRLLGDAAASSLVQERGSATQNTYGLFFSHGF